MSSVADHRAAGHCANKAPVYARVAQPKAIQLTERDVAVLEALWRHRGLSGNQVRRLVLRCGPSMARRRLRALYDHGFVERVRVAAVPTARIPPHVYCVTHRGMRLLPELLAQFCPDLMIEADSAPTASGLSGAGLRFVRHRYLVNELRVTLEEACRSRGHYLRWLHEEDLTAPTERGEGRRAEVVRHPLLREPATFLPDAYCEVTLGTGESLRFFVELDLASHPQRIWRHRARLYAAYADPQVGLFRRRFGRETFRLLILTTPDYRRRSRCDNILRSICESLGRPSDMFLATTLDSLTAERILDRSWKAADGTGRLWSPLDNNPPTSMGPRERVIVVPKGASPARAIV